MATGRGRFVRGYDPDVLNASDLRGWSTLVERFVSGHVFKRADKRSTDLGFSRWFHSRNIAMAGCNACHQPYNCSPAQMAQAVSPAFVTLPQLLTY